MKFLRIAALFLSGALAAGEPLFIRTPADAAASPYDNLKTGVPSFTGCVLDRESFAVGFSAVHRQPLWVQYRLTGAEVRAKAAGRSNRFYKDPYIRKSAMPQDYTRSGYDRGHLAPAADMSYSAQAMHDSFSMSNMSPQLPGFNRGIWKKLEEQIRKFAVAENDIYVVTGVIFARNKPQNKMEKSRIPVPDAFFKAVLDMTPPRKMIAFILPHRAGKNDLRSFAVTVDKLESAAGLDLFSFLPDEEENMLEKSINPELWTWQKE